MFHLLIYLTTDHRFNALKPGWCLIETLLTQPKMATFDIKCDNLNQ
ncbi:MAG: hypothetical protein FD166_2213 [Bacteroidetes bacterium]|nr:MAG: hypothetical protein FD166_2213 [Bacteroidota bacterium]